MTVLVTKPAVNIREELASLNEPQAISDVFGLQTALDAKQDILTEGAFADGDKTKLDGIEANADVTDATNVEAAGAVMDGDFTSNGFMKRTGAGTYTVDTSTYLTSVSALGDIGNVTITDNTAGEILKWDDTSSTWINNTLSEAGVAALSGATFTGDVSLDNSRLLLADGSATSPAIGFTNDQDSGLYYAAGAVRVAFNGTQTFAFDDGVAYSDSLLPSATESYALGGASNRWNTFYTKDGDFSGTTTITTADINGGDIDNTAIGNTTPAAGKFTTLSATGDVTLGSDSADTITVNGTISATGRFITPTELGYIATVTSDVQSQLNAKQDILTEGAFADGDKTKLDGIEANADVTDTDNVESAGALMDSELTNEAAVKSIDQSLTTTSDVTFNKVSATSVQVGSVTNTTLREVLTSNRTYYVDGTNGSDTNDGLSSGAGAFATIQKAIDVAYGNLDLNGYNVTVNVAAATYAGFTASSPQVGKGSIAIIGDTSDPSNCPCGISIISNSAVLTIGGLNFTGSSSVGLWVRGGATVRVVTSIGLGSNTSYGIEVSSNSNLEAPATTIYLYGNTYAVTHAYGGAINLFAVNFTVPNNITVTYSFVSSLNGSILLNSSSKSGAGTVTSGGVYGATDYSTAPAGRSGLFSGTNPL